MHMVCITILVTGTDGFLGFDIFNSWTFLGGLILLGNFLLIQQSEVVIP